MYCNKVKEFLSQRGIEFTERDVTQDEQAQIELEAMEAFSTPVTVIDGEIVIGFNRHRLEQLL